MKSLIKSSIYIRSKQIVLLGALLTSVLISPMSFAANQISQLVPFQGRLHNSEGDVVKDGVYDLTFYLYETPTGGESIWSENHTQVSVIHGYVNVLLGAMEGSDFEGNNVVFSTQKYLSISINGGQEMFPRHQLVPTFHSYNADKLGGKDANTYAQTTYVDNEVTTVQNSVNAINTNISNTINSLLSNRFVGAGNTAKNADKLDNLNSTDFIRSTQINDLVPIGTVLMWPAASKIPTDYRECNGNYISKSTYSALYSIIGTTYGNSGNNFRVPDFRGIFLRGWAHGASTDPDKHRGIGSYQADDFKSHVHGYTGTQGNGSPDGSSDSKGTGAANSYPRTAELDYEGGTETRPKNRAIMYIIKYK